jgi:NAD(P)-dependent dehydrogenase (short-subunit alcohol dehydrogenase family)
MGIHLKNRVCLVTGANRGIGLAIVGSFLKHGCAKIYAGVRSADKANELKQIHGEKITPLVIDYNQAETIRHAAEIANDAEIVVSNAGILNTVQATDSDVIESFQEELEVNVYGLLRMARAFAPVLKKTVAVHLSK